MKRPQTQFHAHTTREAHVIKSKKAKICRWLNFSCSTSFSLYRYFIETTTADIDMLLQVAIQ